MKKFFKDKINNILRDQGLKAGIVPVENPENEDHRLAEVQRLGVLDRDLSGERRYNSMIQLASYLTGCEHSMINILDADIQQCKASFGFNMLRKTMMEEMPREISICQFSLTNPSQPLVIENLMEDDRTKNFSNLPGAPNFNFYAGSPLISSRGFSIGTLCVLDPSPKSLAHKQVEGLRLLSDQVAGMLEN